MMKSCLIVLDLLLERRIEMEKFVPYEKLSKKEKRRRNKEKRNLWETNPATKIVPDKHKEIRDEERSREKEKFDF